MLRIPGSLNAGQVVFDDKGEVLDIPSEAEVRVVRCWDGNKPSIKPLMPQYYIWLQAATVRDLDKQMESREGRNWRPRKDVKTFRWIERLLDRPIDNHSNIICRGCYYYSECHNTRNLLKNLTYT